ncbi:uncharacterized protein MONOS_615 [Monocercomonoides exilis]|uniref:uncharacterized protein n=1 Tax=Monocercomonoides exilis TaxID=2049356 RepID=UPI00355AA917|nr:hypothetical protein MONOS_615 [Monocercomonoides exilis]|eukprot:MONOS_615.1-p1 / transcript=MONOS_615.1 / gene=MONOS_615 / organism=Monocercomonoides_exilis_PA203 / gene_product=unspecified product / transcript_product=unspecified product / location=Mono_scaffold00010:10232-11670(-) / protein_length=437 / sequence_SO=supercontig / SO=protein_coding / is_pseudo=false
MQTTDIAKKYSELFDELEHCAEIEQKQKIKAMNILMNEMDEEEFNYVFTTELYNKINKMNEEKKITMGNAFYLLKSIGYCKALKSLWIDDFKMSSLSKKFENMIVKEEKKVKEGKNEKLLTNLCECYILLNDRFSSGFLRICIPCLLKAALKKDESKETQKEVETALMTLNCIEHWGKEELELLNMNEIKEIIKYHQKCGNLTCLAYYCAWKFMIFGFGEDKSLESLIVNDLHFERKAARELDELAKRIDWKKINEEEEQLRRIDSKDLLALMGWLEVLKLYFGVCQLWSKEHVELINSIVQVFRAGKDYCREICDDCIDVLKIMTIFGTLKVDDLLKGGAVDVVLEEIKQPTMEDKMEYEILIIFMAISRRLIENKDYETDKAKRKEAKRKLFEMMEDEGLEDIITSLCETFDFLNNKYFGDLLSFNISDNFVNV